MTKIDTQTPSTSENRKRRRSWVAWTALIAILIASAAWFQLFHQQKRSIHNFSQLQSSFHQTLSDTAQLEQTLSSLQTQANNQNDQIQTLQAAFNRLQAANSGYETDIALQQVDRYLSQANLSLTFNHDILGAIVLLQTADQRLNTIPDAQVIPLRQAINSAIVKLQAIPNIDYVGTLTKLTALRDQAATIPLFSINTKTQIFQAATVTSAASPRLQGTWEKAWVTTLQTLKTLVVIRNRHEEITPLVTQKQEQFLRQNLQLILQQAQWAVLQHEQAIYQYSLTQASEWIQHYFADNDQATIALQANISQLQKINLAPSTPNLNALINQVHTLQMQINKSRMLPPAVIKPMPLKNENDTEEHPAPAPSTPPKIDASKGDLV